jgi:hypothetical protein
MENNVVILLTGTVDPNGMHFTALSNVDVRRQQYIDSIKFWVNSFKLKVVFIENSDTDMSTYLSKELKTGRLEMLHFNGNNYPREIGKGFGELQCLKYGYNFSSFIKTSNFIFKITGRHKILNFSSFLRFQEENCLLDLLLDYRENLKFSDSRFFAFKPAFIPDYLSKYESILDDSKEIFFEHILAKAGLLAIADDYNFKPLPYLPRIEGVSGTFNIRWKSNFFIWMRGNLRYKLRKYVNY